MAINQFEQNNPEARVLFLKEKLLKLIFDDVCKGLFEKHKLIFAFMLSVKQMLAANKISARQWQLFTKGKLDDAKELTNPIQKPTSISQKTWNSILDTCKVCPSLNQVPVALSSFNIDTLPFFTKSEITLADVDSLPGIVYSNAFEKLLLARALREEKLETILTDFVLITLGRDYVDRMPSDLKKVISESSPESPIIFLLASGADPLSSIVSAARELEMEGRLKLASLGQGQEAKAKELIRSSRLNGDWVSPSKLPFSSILAH
jgi:dynein heavy chain